MSDISVVGIGLMGAAIARALLAEGNSVTVWNRTPGKADELGEAGAVVTSSVREALEASPVTIVVVVGYDVVWELVGSSGADLTQCDVVNFSSGSPDEAIDLAAKFSQVGGHLLEGCLLGYPSSIGTADMMIKYSGDRGAWNRHENLLRPLAGLTDYAGEGHQLANVFDVTVLGFYTSCLVAMLEASAYAEITGLDFALLEPALHLGTAVLDDFITRAGTKIPAKDFAVEDSALTTYLAALDGVVAAMKSAGAASRVTVATRDTMHLGVEHGRGDDDLFVLHDVLSNTQRGGS